VQGKWRWEKTEKRNDNVTHRVFVTRVKWRWRGGIKTALALLSFTFVPTRTLHENTQN